MFGTTPRPLVAVQVQRPLPVSSFPHFDRSAAEPLVAAKRDDDGWRNEARQNDLDVLEVLLAVENIKLSYGTMRTLLDGYTVAGDPLDVHRASELAWAIRHGIRSPRPIPPGWTGVARDSAVPVNDRLSSPLRELDLTWQLIDAGDDLAFAYLRGAIGLLAIGYPLVLPPLDRLDSYRKALVQAKRGVGGTDLVSLLVSSVTERRAMEAESWA